MKKILTFGLLTLLSSCGGQKSPKIQFTNDKELTYSAELNHKEVISMNDLYLKLENLYNSANLELFGSSEKAKKNFRNLVMNIRRDIIENFISKNIKMDKNYDHSARLEFTIYVNDQDNLMNLIAEANKIFDVHYDLKISEMEELSIKYTENYKKLLSKIAHGEEITEEELKTITNKVKDKNIREGKLKFDNLPVQN